MWQYHKCGCFHKGHEIVARSVRLTLSVSAGHKTFTGLSVHLCQSYSPYLFMSLGV